MRQFQKGIGAYNLPFFMLANQYLRKTFVNKFILEEYDLLFEINYFLKRVGNRHDIQKLQYFSQTKVA